MNNILMITIPNCVLIITGIAVSIAAYIVIGFLHHAGWEVGWIDDRFPNSPMFWRILMAWLWPMYLILLFICSMLKPFFERKK